MSRHFPVGKPGKAWFPVKSGFTEQSMVLSVADLYRVLGVLAAILIPLALRFHYIPAPDLSVSPVHPSPSHG